VVSYAIGPWSNFRKTRCICYLSVVHKLASQHMDGRAAAGRSACGFLFLPGAALPHSPTSKIAGASYEAAVALADMTAIATSVSHWCLLPVQMRCRTPSFAFWSSRLWHCAAACSSPCVFFACGLPRAFSPASLRSTCCPSLRQHRASRPCPFRIARTRVKT
jgi:hypothetical protein